MMDITVIAESTPGPIAINCATYTGYKQGGNRRRNIRHGWNCHAVLYSDLPYKYVP